MSATKTISIKPKAELMRRVACIGDATGLPRHAILLRLIRLGLAEVESDLMVILSKGAISDYMSVFESDGAAAD